MNVAQARKVEELHLYEEITGGFPGYYQWDLIVDTIRKHAITRETMTTCWNEWRSRGYKPNNLGWLTQWCITGIEERKNGHKKGNATRTGTTRGKEEPPPQPSDDDLRLAAEIKRKRAGASV